MAVFKRAVVEDSVEVPRSSRYDMGESQEPEYMELDELSEIRKIAMLAIVSDDTLMERLVLKGGNALDLVYKVSPRASLDLDFSMEDDFESEELGALEERVEQLLISAFHPHGFSVFDFRFSRRPTLDPQDMPYFWGGYEIEFKIIEDEKREDVGGDLVLMRRHAVVNGLDGRMSPKFKIQISKFEYCADKQPHDIDGFRVYVYTPVMMVVEKMRTICQQMPEYTRMIGRTHRSPRARDFVDIYFTAESFGIDFTEASNNALFKSVFAAKQVPLSLLGSIKDFREYHQSDFDAVRDTMKPGVELESFDFYFDYVVEIARQLESLWKE